MGITGYAPHTSRMPRKVSKPHVPRPFIREWRKFRRLTQRQLGDRIDQGESSISQIESGKQGISETTLAALAYAFGCEVGDLYRDPTKPDYQLWRIISDMRPEQQARALRLIKALADEAA